MNRIAGTEEQPRIWLWLTAFAVIVAGMTLVAKVLDVDELDTPSYGRPGFARTATPSPPLETVVPVSINPTAVAGDYAERSPSQAGAPFAPVASRALAGHDIALSPVRVTRVIGSRSFFVRPARATTPTEEILVVLSHDNVHPPTAVAPDMRLAVRGTLRELDEVSPRKLGLARTTMRAGEALTAQARSELYIDATRVSLLSSDAQPATPEQPASSE